MRAVGVKELKNKLSDYLRLVEAGEDVLVTSGDRVVARLTRPVAGPTGHKVLDALAAEGLVRAPVGATTGAPERLPVAATEDILHELRTDRDSR